MRKFRVSFGFAVLACALASTASATSVKVEKSARKVAFIVENTSPYAFVCDGKLTARTKSGKYVETAMTKESVAAGGFREIFLTAADDADPFVDGWSDIKCVTPPQPPPPAETED